MTRAEGFAELVIHRPLMIPVDCTFRYFSSFFLLHVTRVHRLFIFIEDSCWLSSTSVRHVWRPPANGSFNVSARVNFLHFSRWISCIATGNHERNYGKRHEFIFVLMSLLRFHDRGSLDGSPLHLRSARKHGILRLSLEGQVECSHSPHPRFSRDRW